MMQRLSRAARRALELLYAWGGDRSGDFEDEIGCHGAACDAVIDSLERRGLVTFAPDGTTPVTDAGRRALLAGVK